MGGGPNTLQPPMPPQYRLPRPDSDPTRPRPIAPPPPMPVAPPPPPPEQRRPPLSFDRPMPVAPPPQPPTLRPSPPLQRPLPISQGGKPILAPLPLRRSPIDMVRDPNYDAVMAQRNYENNLAQSIANSQLQNPPPPPMPSPELQPNGYPKAPPPPSLELRPNRKPKNPPLPKPGQFTQGRLMGAPSNQMDAYNNFLQQGIQGSNTRAF